MDWITMKCLEKDRARRYETANGLALDIERHLSHEPVLARPPSAAYRLHKLWERHKLGTVSVLALTITLLAGVVGTSIGLIRAQRDRQTLERNSYVDSVTGAQRELSFQPPNVSNADKLLEKCSVRLRHWEWRFLKRQRHAAGRQWSNPSGSAVKTLAFSPDGCYLATGGSDGCVRIRDLQADQWGPQFAAHNGFVTSLAFCPTNPDLIASAGSDNELVLWDWRTGTRRGCWPSNTGLPNTTAYSVAFSPDGQFLAAPADEGQLLVYETGTGKVRHVLQGHESEATSVAFSPPDAHWIVTSSTKGGVRLWDGRRGVLRNAVTLRGPPITGVAFSGDGRTFAATHVDGFVEVWETKTCRQLAYYRVGGAILNALAFHPTGERLFTGGYDRIVTVSDPVTQRQVLAFPELGQKCYSLALSPDGDYLAAGAADGSVHLWDASHLKGDEDPRLRRTLEYPGEFWAFGASAGGHSIALGGAGPLPANGSPPTPPQLLVWESPDSPALRFPGQKIVVFSMDFLRSGQKLAFCGDDPDPHSAYVEVLDLKRRQVAVPIERFETNHVLFAVAFSQDERWLLGGGRDGALKVWNAATGKRVGITGSHRADITKISVSPDGRFVASISTDGEAKVWDATRLDQEQAPVREFTGLADDITDALAFSSDGSRLAVTTDNDRSLIHSVDSKAAPVELFSRGHRPLALAFSPDDRWVASGGKNDCDIHLFDAQSGKRIGTFKGHLNRVVRVSFFRRPDGLWLASGSRDGVVKLWSVAADR